MTNTENLEYELGRIADALEEINNSINQTSSYNGDNLATSLSMIAETMHHQYWSQVDREKKEKKKIEEAV